MTRSALTGANVLVVGGAGFVGSNLLLRLLEDEPANVYVVDNLLSSEIGNVPEQPRVQAVLPLPSVAPQRNEYAIDLTCHGPMNGMRGLGPRLFQVRVIYEAFCRIVDSPYYITPDGQVGQDAFAVIREAMRGKDIVALGRVVLAKRERVIMLQPWDKGLMATTLRSYDLSRVKGTLFERQSINNRLLWRKFRNFGC
jgi:hypothetical protein